MKNEMKKKEKSMWAPQFWGCPADRHPHVVVGPPVRAEYARWIARQQRFWRALVKLDLRLHPMFTWFFSGFSISLFSFSLHRSYWRLKFVVMVTNSIPCSHVFSHNFCAPLYTREIMISFTSGWTVFRLPSTPCSNFTFFVLLLQIASERETSCDADCSRSTIQ